MEYGSENPDEAITTQKTSHTHDGKTREFAARDDPPKPKRPIFVEDKTIHRSHKARNRVEHKQKI